jgi:signal transduction histidine kinase
MWDETIKILIYRSVRELIINIIKHAKTKHAEITLTIFDNQLTVSIEDNGVGFDVNKIDKINSLSFGLFSISKRFKALEGEIEIYSEPNRGTNILLIAPLTKEE